VVTRSRRTTLAGQLLALQLVIVVVVLTVVAVLSVAQSAATFNRVEGRRVTALAEQLAGVPVVRAWLVDPTPGEGLAPTVQTVRTRSDVSTVAIADASGAVVSSTNPLLLGTPMPLGSPAVLHGRGWAGELDVDGVRELVVQVPVLGTEADKPGRQLGVVMIGKASPTIWQRLRDASGNLLLYLGIASALGLIGSWLLARRIKRQTLGMEPREIAGLVEHREAMLYGIAEGVIALDPQQRVTLVNEVGRTLLDLPADCVGKSLRELGVGGRLRDVLTGTDRDSERDQVVLRRGRVLVMNRMNVVTDGRRLGSVTTLRDRTELAELEQELGSFRSTTELLRAQTHEFANQLHTISGLIQIRDFDEVVAYVNALAQHRESLDLSITRRIGDTAVAALLMAKSAQAAESRVELRISEQTSLGRLETEDAADVATVVGNLVDNAVDAAASAGGAGSGAAWVEVELRHDASTVEIVVRDSGPGVAPELAQEVFSHGFTTKAAKEGERGIGLALTRLVCRRHGGEVAMTVGRSAARAGAR
jgi:two-component system, CitB family, sensor kinase